MYKEIVECLCCPQCGGGLVLEIEIESCGEVLEGKLLCEKGHAYRISEGVANFNSQEQGFANQWETMAEEQSFEEIDRGIDTGSAEKTLEERKAVLKTIAEIAAETVMSAKTTVSTEPASAKGCSEPVVLDIASGRGMCLTALTEHLDEDVHIISADLSEYVLKYDHKKFKKMAPKHKISYLACDATNLPLKDGVVDAATTYGGFSNMLGCAGEGIKEAHRVLKPGGVLADSFVVIRRDSKGYEVLEQVCGQQNIHGAGEFFLQERLEKEHRALFAAVEPTMVCEGIGVDNGMDLLPYDGEWYAEMVFQSKEKTGEKKHENQLHLGA